MNPIKDDKTHIILTSRIRLARNLKDYPFTEALDPDPVSIPIGRSRRTYPCRSRWSQYH